MKYTHVVTILESNEDTFCNIQRMLEHSGAICLTNIDLNTDIIVANSQEMSRIMDVTCPVILYGAQLYSNLPANFMVLSSTASVFEIHLTYRKLTDTAANAVIDKLTTQQLQNKTVTKIPDSSFILNLHDRPLSYAYAMVEYLYEKGWITIQMRPQLYTILNEIVVIRNDRIANVERILFSNKDNTYYLSVKYCVAPQHSPLVLYILNCNVIRTHNQEVITKKC